MFDLSVGDVITAEWIHPRENLANFSYSKDGIINENDQIVYEGELSFGFYFNPSDQGASIYTDDSEITFLLSFSNYGSFNLFNESYLGSNPQLFFQFSTQGYTNNPSNKVALTLNFEGKYATSIQYSFSSLPNIYVYCSLLIQIDFSSAASDFENLVYVPLSKGDSGFSYRLEVIS